MKIKLGKGVKFRGQSLFIKVDKTELDVLPIIKSFRCYYHTKEQMWEVPKTAFNTLVDKCKNYELIIIGKLEPAMNDYLDLLDLYDTPTSDYTSKTKPYSYQLESFTYSKLQNKMLLADEQGLGKTKQALDIAVSRKGHMKHCLIVCGVNELKWNWYNEVAIHTEEKAHILGLDSKGNIGSVKSRLDDLRNDHQEFFIITNIETLRNQDIQREVQIMCETGVIGMTIIDEIHKCKNPTSLQGKAIHCCKSYYKLALTGTPLMNNAIDLYNVMKWLEIDNRSLTDFKNRYCIMGGFGGYQIVGYKNLDELHDLLNGYMLRRRKDDVLDLPPKVYTDEILDMSKAQSDIYKEVKKQIQDNIDKIMLLPNPLTELIRLRQVTANPSILTSNNVPSVKYNRLVELVEEVVSSGSKCIVFSNWTQVINPAYNLLLGHNPVLVTGETKNNDKAIQKFKTDETCKVILGTIPCLGTGFTLNEANTVIFLDEPWTSADKLQAEDRCHRIGTKGTVNIITLICKNTVDEKIHKLLNSKQELSDQIVDNKKLFMEVIDDEGNQ